MSHLDGLKVCFLAGTLGQGGAERQLFYMVSALKENDALPRVLCLTEGEYWQERIEAIGVPVVWVGQSHSRLMRLQRIIRELQRDPPLVLQSQHFYANIYAVAAARFLGLHEVGAVRSDGIAELGANQGILGRLSLMTPRIIAANSRTAIKNAVTLGARGERLFYLPNVVDTALFTPQPRISNDGIRVITVGHMAPVKRFDRFIRVLAEVRNRASVPVRGTIVGDGPLRPSLESLAAALSLGPGDLEFFGAATEVRSLYSDADILVLTSDREGTPNVILEAMASGLPVVATRVGGLPDVVRHGETGFLVDRDDESSLIDAVLDLVQSREKRSAFGQSARQFVEENHALPRLAVELGRLYETVLTPRSTTRTIAQPITRPSAFPERIVIVSHVVHYRDGDRLLAYGPYALEIGIWARLFPQISIAAPCRAEAPPGDCLALPANVRVLPQPETGGTTVRAKLAQLFMLPMSVWRLCSAMQSADAIHVRCPGNIGLLGVLFSPLFSRKRIAKFAGEWDRYDGEAVTVRLQRWLLRSRWWNAPVMVYTDKKERRGQIVPFFTPALTAGQLTRARATATARDFAPPRCVLYAGRLSAAKNVHVLLDAVAEVSRDGIPFTCTIVGDGPEREALESRASTLGISNLVRFEGAVSPNAVLDYYEAADLLVLASQTEGWPKTLTEGMAFGLICVGSDRGLMTSMLGEGRGLLVPPGDSSALARALHRAAIMTAEEIGDMRARATAWAGHYTAEQFENSLRGVLDSHWRAPSKQAPQRFASVVSQPTLQRAAVMHVTDTLEIGGAERMAVSLANYMPRSRFEPHLCTTRRSGPLADVLRPDVGRCSLDRRLTFDISAVLHLVTYIRRHKIRIIHAHGSAVFMSAAASLFKPFPAVIWHIHYGRHATETRVSWQYRLIKGRVKWAIGVSEALASWARNNVGVQASRVTYIPNFSQPTGHFSTLTDFPGTKGERIVCVANFVAEKDHLTLLRAMREIVQSRPTTHLLLVGAGSNSPWGQAAQEYIQAAHLEANVSLLGQRRDVFAILHACDIGVLSSKVEGLPLALIEYGEAGLPVVVTAVGQCADVVDHGKAGIVVQPGDDAQLAEALLQLLSSPRERATLGETLRTRVREKFSADNSVELIYAIYDSVLGREKNEKEEQVAVFMRRDSA